MAIRLIVRLQQAADQKLIIGYHHACYLDTSILHELY